ncbi:secondary metabolism biosynthetic enzyme [Penicillium pulvis]|uniref:secondary metabolism biosynthetic enzyme n=1 Tax=Penicillium pulvis TaxID=1562058 RepID=UPI0025479E39|nr:secondary metabolism biosynthetic enzyme [Penicillium pulvis]KAJ5813520.1 secondary metabolism biosynthetic enzyme [Penicillium pulvis]
MTAVGVTRKFDPMRFLTDFKRTSDAIGASYSEPSILETLNTFKSCFQNSIVIWRTTNRENDPLNYRFFLQQRLNTVEIAIKAGYIEPDNQMGRLITSWSALYNGESQQWCDFHPERGLVKTWVNLKRGRPVNDILNAPGVPYSVQCHGPTFRSLGLELVSFVAVDYESSTMNIYFIAPGPISETQAAQYTALAQCKPPTREEFQDMRSFLDHQGFTFAITMDYETGAVTRVAFYALNLSTDRLPAIGERLLILLEAAPSYDRQQTICLAWSFGLGDKKYMKAESSYVGDFTSLLSLGSPRYKTTPKL